MPTLFLNYDKEYQFIDKQIEASYDCDCDPETREYLHILAGYIANGRNFQLLEQAHELLDSIDDFKHFHDLINQFSYELEYRDTQIDS